MALVADTDVPYDWIRIRAIPGTPDVQLRCARCAEVRTVDTVSTRLDLARVANSFVILHKHCRPRTLH